MAAPTLDPLAPADDWFARQGWTPFPFQREVWRAYLDGESGLIHSATGTGKTLAAWLGPLLEARANPAPRLQALWITPLRALASDTQAALQAACDGLGLGWEVGRRTGDTSSHQKARQAKRMPEALVITPESLSLLLSRPDAAATFRHLRAVIVDEWHELMSTKRGVQTELALARLRRWNPGLRTWGVSATLGNLEEALRALVGPGREGRLVRGHLQKEIVIDALLPPDIERFPWAGHLGVRLLPQLIEAIDASRSCLVFANTRSQVELWFQAILDARPDWKGKVELHHGSLDREVRDAVEMGIKTGQLRAVVCTSSLDLGVDFSPVDRVIQIGSPKGVARLLQRAGRSGHQPGAPSRVTCLPTHALELVDIAAAREAAAAGRIEGREGIARPLDVLAQHLVTVALGGGFRSEELFAEVRETAAYANLTPEEWEWTLDFVTRGGEALRAYPEYRRVASADGFYVVLDHQIATRHRLSIGTIVSDAAVNVQMVKGGRLGTVEESFVARLRPGDQFTFAGRLLEFVRMRDMTCWVTNAKKRKGALPRWMGGRLPLSTELAVAIRERLEEAKAGELIGPEMRTIAPILDLQARWSAVPDRSEFLIERVETEDGHHLFFFPFEGRLVHEGLAALFATRLSRRVPITFSLAANDYGFELLSPDPAPLEDALTAGLLSTENLAADIVESLNAAEMAKRQFREVARIAGLVFEGFPGKSKSARQLQASSGLFYDVFARFDPENLLLLQANREVLERQLEQSRLARTLGRLSDSRLLICEPPRPTPLAFPILVDRLRETITSEDLADRIERMIGGVD